MNQQFQSPDGVKMPIPVAKKLSELAYAVDILEEHLNMKVSVLRGYISPNLCIKQNIPHSPHCYGKAIELSVEGMPVEQVADALENLMHCDDIPKGKIKKLKKSVYYETY